MATTPTSAPTTHSPVIGNSSLKDLAVSLDKTHRALSDLGAGPFITTLQALDQTSFNLQSTSRLLSDSEQNLNKYQANIEALVTRIKNAKDFLPSDD